MVIRSVLKKALAAAAAGAVVSGALCGCGHKEDSLQGPVISFQKDLEKNLDSVPSLDQLEANDINTLFQPAKSVSYPQGEYFIPSYFSDNGNLYGISMPYAQGVPDWMSQQMAALNLADGQEQYIDTSGSPVNMCRILGAGDAGLVMEVINPVNLSADILLYRTNGSRESICTIENIPAIMYNSAVFSDGQIMLNLYQTDPQSSAGYKYINILFNPENSDQKVVEDSFCSYPCFCSGKWVYLCIDNENKTTRLIQYDPGTEKKAVLSETTNPNLYLYALCSSSDRLFTAINTQNGIVVCKQDGDTWIPLFKTEELSLFHANERYLTWTAKSLSEDRERIEYYLYDFTDDLFYPNPNGVLYINQDSELLVQYLKSDSEIPKGEIYQPENSVLRLLEN